MYFNQQVTNTIPRYTCSMKKGLQVHCVPGYVLTFCWDIKLYSSIPHGSGQLPMHVVHGQEEPNNPHTSDGD